MATNGSHHPRLCPRWWCVEGIRRKTQSLTTETPLSLCFPRHERCALAKLAVCGARLEGQQPEKAEKDLTQAASLIDCFEPASPSGCVAPGRTCCNAALAGATGLCRD